MIEHVLAPLGLDEKASRLYLAGLELGTTTIQELARVSRLKRPTVYLHIDALIKEGLFEIVSSGSKRLYRATEPSVVEERLKQNLQSFQADIPKLLEFQAQTLGKPQVQVFTGIENVRQLYREACMANSTRAWSNVGGVYAEFHDVYMEIAEAAKAKGAGFKEIVADTKESRRYARFISKLVGPTYIVRIATVEGFENDTLIYGNVVAIFRIQGHNVFAVRIEDPGIANTMRAVHEMSWKTAKSLR